MEQQYTGFTIRVALSSCWQRNLWSISSIGESAVVTVPLGYRWVVVTRKCIPDDDGER